MHSWHGAHCIYLRSHVIWDNCHDHRPMRAHEAFHGGRVRQWDANCDADSIRVLSGFEKDSKEVCHWFTKSTEIKEETVKQVDDLHLHI